jgi:hypothetical protein
MERQFNTYLFGDIEFQTNAPGSTVSVLMAEFAEWDEFENAIHEAGYEIQLCD